MKMQPKCGTCRHWLRWVDKQTERGNCRRFPPAAVDQIVANSRGTISGRVIFVNPNTKVSDLCGEYKAKKGFWARLWARMGLWYKAKKFVKRLYKTLRG